MTSKAITAALPPVEALYARHGRMVLRRVRRFYRGVEAEDVLQEVFEQVLRIGHSFEGRSTVRTWLYALTTRHCLIRLRNSRRRAELLDTHGHPEWCAPALAPDAEAVAFLAQLWRSVDPDLAEIGVYYHVDGMSQADIGALLGVTGRTISNRLKALTTAVQALESP